MCLFKLIRVLNRAWALLVLGLALAGYTALAGSPANQTGTVNLGLNQFLQLVLHRNEELQAQMIETEVSHRKEKSTHGAFEPLLEASVQHVINQRTNDVQQQAALLGEPSFSEQNNLYDSGVESLLPTGAKIRLGYSLSDFYNNASASPLAVTTSNFTRQFVTFVGFTFSQPLLKDGGFTPTLAELRLAAMDSEIAFQQYRHQLMLTLSRAESAYWNLYFAQQQLKFFDQSVAVAGEVLDDTREKLLAGQGSELDVMESQSELALRQTKRNEALQSYYDAVGSMQSLAGGALFPWYTGANQPTLNATDSPPETNSAVSFFDAAEGALSLNPDYLIQLQKMRQEEVRVGVAKNQVLPQLDFKGAYGYNGLGFSPGSSWELAAQQQYPSWSVGLELILPMGGNIKARNLLHAQELGLQEAYMNLKNVQQEIGNHLATAMHKVSGWQQSTLSCQTVVHYNETLLKTELERLKAGSVDGHKVLEVEEDLLDSRQELANAQVQYACSCLELQIASGTLLKEHNMDVTRNQLKIQTDNFLAGVQKSNSTF